MLLECTDDALNSSCNPQIRHNKPDEIADDKPKPVERQVLIVPLCMLKQSIISSNWIGSRNISLAIFDLSEAKDKHSKDVANTHNELHGPP